jgi:hypothetical protein
MFILSIDTSVAENKVGGSIRPPLAFYREVFLVESINFTLDQTFANHCTRTAPHLKEAIQAVSSGFLGFGKKGNVTLKANIRTLRVKGSEIEPGVWRSGDMGYVGIEVQNDSAKKVTELDVSLVRIVKTFKFDSVEYRPVSFAKKEVQRKTLLSQKGAAIQSGRDIRESSRTLLNGWTDDKDNSNSINSWSGVLPSQSKLVLIHLDIPVRIAANLM